MTTSKDRRDRIAELQTRIENARAALCRAHEEGSITVKADREASTLIDDLNKQLHAAIIGGAIPCPNCGLRADGTHTVRGLAHELGVKGSTRRVYEIGCITASCRNVRVTDLLPELAEERWNEGDYDKPSKGPGVKLEADAEAVLASKA